MTDEINAETLDIADLFSGTAFPTDTVTFYTNADIAYRMRKLSQKAIDAARDKDEKLAKEVEAEREELVKSSERFRYVAHLQGQSRENQKAVRDVVIAEFPIKRDFLGREEENPEADEKHTNMLWAMYITKIVGPSGAILRPHERDIAILRGNTPDSEIMKIAQGINALASESANGFEMLAQEHDFLSSASHEA